MTTDQHVGDECSDKCATPCDHPDCVACVAWVNLRDLKEQKPPPLTAAALPCVIATLLPDGNINIAMPNGSLPVDKMFTISALVTRLANQAMDDAEARNRVTTLEVARDMSAARRLQG